MRILEPITHFGGAGTNYSSTGKAIKNVFLNSANYLKPHYSQSSDSEFTQQWDEPWLIISLRRKTGATASNPESARIP